MRCLLHKLHKPIHGEEADTLAMVLRFETAKFYHQKTPKDILVGQYPLVDRLLCETCPKEHRERLRTFIADRLVKRH
jgi:hypothetical protein